MTTPPATPLTVSGTVYDKQRSASASAIVKLTNLRTQESMSQTCDSAGHYLFSLHEFPTAWANGDRWRFDVKNSDSTQKTWWVFETSTGDSDKEDINLYLHDISGPEYVNHGAGSRTVYFKSDNLSTTSTAQTAVILPPVQVSEFKMWTIHLANTGAVNVTFKIYGSIDPPNWDTFRNRSQPPSDITNTKYWFQIGQAAGYTVAATTGSAHFPAEVYDEDNVLLSRCRYITAVAYTASGTATGLYTKFIGVGGE